MRVALLVYTTFAVVVTWPLARALGSAVPGWPGDQPFYIWALDSYWSEISAGRFPFHTDRVLYPLGANLMQMDTGPAEIPLAGPFWLLGGPEGVRLFFGLMGLAAPIVGGLGMRAAVRTLTRNESAAFWAGLFYAGAPAFISFASAPFLFKAHGGAILPWGLAALLRFLDTPGRASLLALSAVAWLLLFTSNYATFMFLALVVGIGIVNLRPALVRPIAAGLAANGLLAVVVLATILPPLDPNEFTPGDDFFWRHSNANLADFLVPGVHLGEIAGAMVWPGVLNRLGAYESDHGPDPDSYFIGYGMLALIALGVCRHRRSRRVWGLVAAAVLLTLLSCGTQIRWGQTVLAEGRWTPFHWVVYGIPWLQFFDQPRCFSLGAAVAWVALAGVGLATLAWPPRAVGALALTIFVIDYGRIGIPVYPIDAREIDRVLAAMPDDRVLLELPGGVSESKGGLGLNYDGVMFEGRGYGVDNNPAMYWQTIHRKRRIAGHIPRVPYSAFEFFVHEPILGDLLILTNHQQVHECYRHKERRTVERLPEYPSEAVDAFVKKFDLGFVLFRPHEKRPLYMAETEKLLGDRIAERRTIDGYELFILKP
jgi:hypothetical protein